MSLTFKQQELIDETISTFIHNYDRIAQSYLAVRQSILSLEDSPESHKVKQLQYELVKCKELYTIHIENLLLRKDQISKVPFTHTVDLNEKVSQLQGEKIQLNREIENLTKVQKPLLDDMRVLLKSFNDALDKRTAKKFPILTRNGRVQEQYQTGKSSIDLSQLEFEESELKEVFKEIQERLASRDEQNANISQVKVLGHLNEYLENGRTLKRLEGSKYLYDVSAATGKISDKTIGSNTTVAEYDQMIEDVENSIKELIQSGVETRERWSSNAQKLDLIKEAVQ
ncbi:hypothetical protein CLIB1423_11S04148 [[Candida] railenensis]|uniref:Uncharacterized protein n=1 Tax=[Candida] railenensis TaxID=45579 RepID=A0A9P0QRW3_9ASCO|nr:hypothetical protein CLIB1423_11S04148 [[Candida] railenensis]